MLTHEMPVIVIFQLPAIDESHKQIANSRFFYGGDAFGMDLLPLPGSPGTDRLLRDKKHLFTKLRVACLHVANKSIVVFIADVTGQCMIEMPRLTCPQQQSAP